MGVLAKKVKIGDAGSKLAPKGPKVPKNVFGERSELLGGKMSLFKHKTCILTKKRPKNDQKWAKNEQNREHAKSENHDFWVKIGPEGAKIAPKGFRRAQRAVGG